MIYTCTYAFMKYAKCIDRTVEGRVEYDQFRIQLIYMKHAESYLL